jgi:hypothetical protein
VPSGEQAFMTALNPALNAPDRVAWCLFVYVNSQASTAGNNNALFETWASDDDTFQPNPQWPGPTTVAKSLRVPILPHLAQQSRGGTLTPFVLPFQSGAQCPPSQPGQPPALCIGEEVRRNFVTFDFIRKNHLYTRDGLKAFTQTITFPSDSIEVKANWVPVSQLSQFLTNGASADPSLYHVNTTTENGQQVQYALVSMHVISKMVPNWTWATYEHRNNPGRCDVLGCYDTFGANPPSVAPNPQTGGLYPNCEKTPSLQAVFANNKIDPAYANYCLKGSQTDFTDPTGVNIRVGNSVTEAGFLDTASCMSCHGRAAYSFVTGAYAPNRVFLYNSTPIGPLGPINPAQFWQYGDKDPARPRDAALFRATDFVWSIPFCAISSDPTARRPCASK